MGLNLILIVQFIITLDIFYFTVFFKLFKLCIVFSFVPSPNLVLDHYFFCVLSFGFSNIFLHNLETSLKEESEYGLGKFSNYYYFVFIFFLMNMSTSSSLTKKYVEIVRSNAVTRVRILVLPSVFVISSIYQIFLWGFHACTIICLIKLLIPFFFLFFFFNRKEKLFIYSNIDDRWVLWEIVVREVAQNLFLINLFIVERWNSSYSYKRMPFYSLLTMSYSSL